VCGLIDDVYCTISLLLPGKVAMSSSLIVMQSHQTLYHQDELIWYAYQIYKAVNLLPKHWDISHYCY